MADREQPATLEYATPGPKQQSGLPRPLALLLAIGFLLIGVLFCSVIGLPAFIASCLQGRPEPAAVMFIVVGAAFCAVGMRLKRRR